MNDDIVGVSSGDGAVEIVLVGGPTDIPEAMRSQRATVTCDKIKMKHAGGYEHFELVDTEVDTEDRTQTNGQIVFRWIMRTKIAE